jgi:hypothetical protein
VTHAHEGRRSDQQPGQDPRPTGAAGPPAAEEAVERVGTAQLGESPRGPEETQARDAERRAGESPGDRSADGSGT